jgi:hypothetical protein
MAITTPEFRPVVQSKDPYVYSTYPSKTPKEARQYIKALLDNKNFAVSVSPTIASQLRSAAGSSTDNIQSLMKAHGIVHVNTIVESSEYHYAIETGQPVCFEIYYGKYLTGINPAWGVDEYKIVGAAMAPNSGGLKRIPVLLNKYEKGSGGGGGGGYVLMTGPSGVPARVGNVFGSANLTKYSVAEDGTITEVAGTIKAYNPAYYAVGQNKIVVTEEEQESSRQIIVFEACP